MSIYPEDEMGRLLSFKGRMGRLQFSLVSIAILFCEFFLGFLTGFIAFWTGAGRLNQYFFIIIISACAIIVHAFQIIKRLHDLGKHRSHYWLIFIPIYNLYLIFLLFFKKGTIGQNAYGPDPNAVSANL